MSDDDIPEFDNAEKRAHHNALERKRRDHIKDSFSSLRDSVPALKGEKVVSRALILKKAADYIAFMRKKNTAHQYDIDSLKRQNVNLERQIRKLQKSQEREESGYLGESDVYQNNNNEDFPQSDTSESSMSSNKKKKPRLLRD